MSLLYECINGIIQGGILTEAEGTQEGDEIASLCVNKLRGMVVMDADPNRKSLMIDSTDGLQKSLIHLQLFSQIRRSACIQPHRPFTSTSRCNPTKRDHGLPRRSGYFYKTSITRARSTNGHV